jgi:hypothetical protein
MKVGTVKTLIRRLREEPMPPSTRWGFRMHALGMAACGALLTVGLPLHTWAERVLFGVGVLAYAFSLLMWLTAEFGGDRP